MSVDLEADVRHDLEQAMERAGMPPREISLRKIPFEGAWGYATTVCMQLANEQMRGELAGLPKNEAKAAADARAQLLAEGLADELRRGGRYANVEAIRGFVNVYLDTAEAGRTITRQVIEMGERYGAGEPKTEHVMVEYSQPNTHKALHVGHLRNLALGDSLARLIAMAGYPTLKATYPGDMGKHVIKCLWCYQRFHQGDEPAERRGWWLGQVYAESDRRLEIRQEVLDAVLRYVGAHKDDPAALAEVDEVIEHLVTRGEYSREEITRLHDQAVAGKGVKLAEVDARALRAFWAGLCGLAERRELQQRASEADNELLQLRRARVPFLQDWDLIPQYENEIKDLFAAWERQEPVVVDLWRRTRQWCLDEFNRVYDELGVNFDVWFFESEQEDAGREIVKELLEKGIAEISDGMPVVKIDEKLGLAKPKYRTLPILRSDNSTLYATKDLALAKQKFETYHVDQSIYVVDTGQSLYFQQIFKILELWGFPQAAKCYHLAYEIVTLPTGKMSSRTGTVVAYEELAEEAVRRAAAVVAEKSPDMPAEEQAQVARQVGLGAIKYAMLAVTNTKQIIFDWEAVLSLDGQSAPYIQYAHARACRILEKALVPFAATETPGPRHRLPAPAELVQWHAEADFTGLEPVEREVLEQVTRFPGEIERAAKEHSPTHMATFVYQLAQLFAEFYRQCPVLGAPTPGQRAARLLLVNGVRQVLHNGLELMGIAAPEFM